MRRSSRSMVLIFYWRAVTRVGGQYKVDADGGVEVIGKGVVDEAEEEGRLAHTGAAHQQQLEQIVAIRVSFPISYYSEFI